MTHSRPVVYLLGWTPDNDTIWGVYATREAAEAASVELGRQHGRSEAVGWIEEMTLRYDGSIPAEPVVG
jgi:hypothetical protein